MDMTGEYRIPAPRQRVWEALNDPDILKAAIPGCEELHKISDRELEARVKAKVGPVSATFGGKVTLQDLNPPESYTIQGEGKGGAAGFARGGASVQLEEAGTDTVLRYQAKADVGGKLAQIGSRLVQGAAKKTADDFFSRFSAIVAERHAVEGAAGAPPPAGPVAEAAEPIAESPPPAAPEPPAVTPSQPTMTTPTPLPDSSPAAAGMAAAAVGAPVPQPQPTETGLILPPEPTTLGSARDMASAPDTGPVTKPSPEEAGISPAAAGMGAAAVGTPTPQPTPTPATTAPRKPVAFGPEKPAAERRPPMPTATTEPAGPGFFQRPVVWVAVAAILILLIYLFLA